MGKIIYVVANAYTPNKRGADGEVLDLEIFKTKEDALEFIKKDFSIYCKDKEPSYYNERNMRDSEGNEWLEIDFWYTTDWEDDNKKWLIKEFDLEKDIK